MMRASRLGRAGAIATAAARGKTGTVLGARSLPVIHTGAHTGAYGAGAGAVRQMSSKFIADIDDDYEIWPKTRTNTIINICQKGEQILVERMGELRPIVRNGWFVALPIIDDIRFVVDMRERAISITPQSSITKDNVHVQVSGNLYCQFVDAEKAAYGSKNPIYAVKQHAQSAMRAAIGELELDQILHSRAQLNVMVRTAVQEAAAAWGLSILRYEITEIHPDRHITEAMDKQAAAERERRKKVLEAEGDKRSAELESEGQKIRLINESEGWLIKVRNEAEGRRYQLVQEAAGAAEAALEAAKAQAQAIALLGKELHREGQSSAEGKAAGDAARLLLAKDYVSMYGEMGRQSNTMIFSERPGDLNALLAQASHVVSSALAPQTGLAPGSGDTAGATGATGTTTGATTGATAASTNLRKAFAASSTDTTTTDSDNDSTYQYASDSDTLAPYADLLGDKYNKKY
jgi:regulator of protease activity HflC (stomatin/prohibitin superfamily)